jgi:hypothetical protein
MDVCADQYFKYIKDYNKESPVTWQVNLHMKPPISYPRFSKEVNDWLVPTWSVAKELPCKSRMNIYLDDNKIQIRLKRQKVIPQINRTCERSKQGDWRVAANRLANKEPCWLYGPCPFSSNLLTSHQICHANVLETCNEEPVNKITISHLVYSLCYQCAWRLWSTNN